MGPETSTLSEGAVLAASTPAVSGNEHEHAQLHMPYMSHLEPFPKMLHLSRHEHPVVDALSGLRCYHLLQGLRQQQR